MVWSAAGSGGLTPTTDCLLPMEQLYPDNCELSARAAFYESLSSLQSELLDCHGCNARLVDALRLMPQHGFSWFCTDDSLMLAHCKGHLQGASCQTPDKISPCLSALLGLPDLLGLNPEPTEDPEPTTSPAQPTTSPAPAATSPAPAPPPDTESEPEVATEADPSLSHEPLTNEHWATADGLIKSLQVGPRKQFVAAFREAFNIPKETQVSAAITEMRHLVFVQRFVSETEGVPMP